MKTRILYSFIVCYAILFSFSSCEKNEDAKGSLQFESSVSALKSTGTDVQITNAIVSIIDTKGTKIYDNYKIEIFNMNGCYISKPLSLKTGEYKLSSFLLTDNNTVVYAAPCKDSPKAYLVSSPLPIDFSISKDYVTKFVPEVVRVESCIPSDFGYSTFSFQIVETFDLLLGVFFYDSTIRNFKLTNAGLVVSCEGKPLISADLGNVTNVIKLPSGKGTYNLAISKTGYKTFSKSYSEELLRTYNGLCDSAVLKIILKKGSINDGLVAYYPFNGNANDESGHGNNGSVFGASLTENRKGRANSAYHFNGYNNYIDCGKNPIIKRTASSFSLSYWFCISQYAPGTQYAVLSNRYRINGDVVGGSMISMWGEYYKTSTTHNFLYQKVGLSTKAGYDSEWGSSVSSAALNTWTFVTILFDYKGQNQNTVTVYINGVRESDKQISDILDPTVDAHTFIGFEPVDKIPNDYHFLGKLDDIRIYNRTLTDDEVKMLYSIENE